MQNLKDIMYISVLVEAGIDRNHIAKIIESGKFICPNCFKEYTPIYSSKQLAFRTNNLISREQWLSHICSDECWNKYVGGEQD